MEVERHSSPVPPVPEDESERLDELYRLQLLDAASNRRFDHYTSLVAEIFQFPVVLVSFVDKDREWFKSAVGIEQREVRRDISFCAHAIGYQDVMVVPDASRDPRFASNPLVSGPPYIRFYAGAVLHSPRNKALGALCVLDYKPRNFDEADRQRLRKFADLLESEVRSCYQYDRLRERLEYAAYFDSLTWLPNRRLLMDRLHKMLQTAAQQGDELAVLAFHVPHLRLINQSFGAESTNRLLDQVGDRLIACCPPNGTVCHLQADEFILALPGSADDILALAARAHNLLAGPFRLSGEDHYLNVRFGTSHFPDDGSSPAELVEQASTAALAWTGHAGPAFYHQGKAAGTAELDVRLQSNLRRALEEELYHFVYQPIVNIRSGLPAYAEALMRWDDAELAELDSMQVMAIAETAGLVHRLGNAVQQAILRQRQLWQKAVKAEIPLSFNVSAPELNSPGFGRKLLRDFQNHEVDPATMTVEVTEYSMVADSSAVADNIQTLRLAGVQINVDDFGTGYSALGYLNRLAVSGIKIDRSFIERIPFSRRQATLTLTILSMADALELSTVAEGVETQEQFDFLARTNCRYAQGFFLSPPVEADLLPRLWGHQLV